MATFQRSKVSTNGKETPTQNRGMALSNHVQHFWPQIIGNRNWPLDPLVHPFVAVGVEWEQAAAFIVEHEGVPIAIFSQGEDTEVGLGNVEQC